MMFLANALIITICILFYFSPAIAADAEDKKPDDTDAKQDEEPVIDPIKIGHDTYTPQGKRKIGPFRIHPFACHRSGVDSNIFLTDHKRIKSYLSVTEAGIRTDLNHRKQKFNVGYRYRVNRYGKPAGRDNSEKEGDVKALLRGGNTFLKIDSTYASLYEQTPAFLRLKTRRQESKDKGSVGLEMKKLHFELGYESRRYHFQGASYARANNRHAIYFGVLGYKFSKKTSIKTLFENALVRYDKKVQNDYDYNSLYLGFEHKVAKKLISLLYVGATRQNVDIKYNLLARKEFHGLSYSGSLKYKMAKKLALKLSLLRELQYSANVNYTTSTVGKIRLDYNIVPKKLILGVRGKYDSSKPSKTTSTAIPSNKKTIGCSLRYNFTPYMSLGAEVEWANKSSRKDAQDYGKSYAAIFFTFYF